MEVFKLLVHINFSKRLVDSKFLGTSNLVTMYLPLNSSTCTYR